MGVLEDIKNLAELPDHYDKPTTSLVMNMYDAQWVVDEFDKLRADLARVEQERDAAVMRGTIRKGVLSDAWTRASEAEAQRDRAEAALRAIPHSEYGSRLCWCGVGCLNTDAKHDRECVEVHAILTAVAARYFDEDEP